MKHIPRAIGLCIIGICVVIAFGTLVYVRHNQPSNGSAVTFQGRITSQDSLACGADGTCYIAVDDKKVITGCGLAPSEVCPRQAPPDTVIGETVRVTAIKVSDDYYGLGCATCGISKLK